jgi:hypothetical protein
MGRRTDSTRRCVDQSASLDVLKPGDVSDLCREEAGIAMLCISDAVVHIEKQICFEASNQEDDRCCGRVGVLSYLAKQAAGRTAFAAGAD